MRYQDQVVRQTQKALDDVCRAALAVPEDRRDWRPGGEARSTLAQMQEIAVSAAFFLPILKEGRVPGFDESSEWASRSNQTVEGCIDLARQSTSAICDLIAEVPDSRLEEELSLPFGGGMVLTMADLLGLHYWNLVYHLGQINQIQLMLGDKAMH